MKFIRRKNLRGQAAICSVVVVAAGQSTRMGQDKILSEICGVPAIIHTLRTFDRMEEILEIIVVTREDLIPRVAELCREHRLLKVKKIVRGGANRMESSRIGTVEAERDVPLIAIHDGARPFVPEEVIRNTISCAARTGAAAPAVPLKDTVKLVEQGVVEKTLDRKSLMAVQTPQIFDSSLIRAALQSAIDDQAELTDDCSAVERLGMKVSLTNGSEKNIKLTTPTDLMLAEFFATDGRVQK